MKYPRGCIIQFAKRPTKGQVKTRLATSIGEERALLLHKKLMTSVTQICCEAELCPVQLWLSEVAEKDDFLDDLSKKYPIDIRVQWGDTLGDRMRNAINKALQHYEFVIVIGSDSPEIDAGYLEQAAAKMADAGADSSLALGPAEDGGYVLIGMRKPEARLFSGIEWGSARVLKQTKAIANKIGWSVQELPILWDVDREVDYRRLILLDPDWAV